MAEDLLQKLKEIDPAILTDVVRQDQNNPAFEITEWDVKRLSDKGIANPDGLWLFSGEGNGNDGKHSWAVVLKVFDIPEEELPLDHLWYWKREALFAQSDLAQNLPGPIRIPHYYRIDEQEDQLQLWMEHLQTHRPNPWTLDEYAFAAHQLGRWNGACLTRMSTAIEPWLAKQQYRVWSSNADPETNLQFHLNQKYILGDTRARYEHLCAEYEMFCNVLEALPQSFSHYDTHGGGSGASFSSFTIEDHGICRQYFAFGNQSSGDFACAQGRAPAFESAGGRR